MINIEPGLIQTLLISVGVLILGSILKNRSTILQKYFIPAPVIGGFLFAAVVAILSHFEILNFTISNNLSNIFMIVFFTTVGFSASFKFLKAGGKGVFIFLCCAIGLVIAQNILGISLATIMGLPTALGMSIGSTPLTGGHGTAAAFAPILEENFGLANASSITIAAATFGLIAGGVIGGPIGRLLMRRYNLVPENEALVKTENNEITSILSDAKDKLTEKGLQNTLICIIIAITLGEVVSNLLEQLGLIVPKYIGPMLIAATMRNIIDCSSKFHIHEQEMQTTGSFALSIFLAMVLMQMQLNVLIELALPILVLLVGQVTLMAIYAYFITFRVMGKNYNAAVMACGHCGFGLGATPNALANMQAFTDSNFPSPQSFLILPLVGALFIDFANSAIITTFLNFIH